MTDQEQLEMIMDACNYALHSLFEAHGHSYIYRFASEMQEDSTAPVRTTIAIEQAIIETQKAKTLANMEFIRKQAEDCRVQPANQRHRKGA